MIRAAISAAGLLLALLLLSGSSTRERRFENCPRPAWGFALEGAPISTEQLQEVEARTGIRPATIVFYVQWPERTDAPVRPFPRESLEAIAGIGALPCLTWEPLHVEGGVETMIDARDILSGRYDDYIAAFAREARDWGHPFLLRFAHEMNLSRYHWGTGPGVFGPESPELYRRMYRHVVERFREAGGRNAAWVFCPNADSVPDPSRGPGEGWNYLANYYPGDDVVDLLGLDGYNWGPPPEGSPAPGSGRWRSFREIFGSARDQLHLLSAGKPVGVFETASVDRGGDKRAWMEEAQQEARRWGLRALVWFQADKERDWRMETGTGRTGRARAPDGSQEAGSAGM